MELPGDDLTLIAYTADVGSQAEDQLRLLATWAATRRLQRTNRPCAVLGPARLITEPICLFCSPTSASTERNENLHA